MPTFSVWFWGFFLFLLFVSSDATSFSSVLPSWIVLYLAVVIPWALVRWICADQGGKPPRAAPVPYTPPVLPEAQLVPELPTDPTPTERMAQQRVIFDNQLLHLNQLDLDPTDRREIVEQLMRDFIEKLRTIEE